MRRISTVGGLTLGVAVAFTLVGCGQAVGKKASDAGTLPGVVDGGAVALTPRAPEVIVGEALAQARGCVGCHSSTAGLLAGSNAGVGGQPVYAPNLTPDPATGVGEWTDEALITAIRYGIDDEGATLCSEMPREPDLSDADAAKLVAWLRSVPAIVNTTNASSCTPRLSDIVLHGQLVARENGCGECHGPALSGIDTALPRTSSYAPNLTPDLDTGLGSWTTQQIADAVKLGVDDEGAQLCGTMPRFDALTDEEATAIATYLQSLTPSAHQVPTTICEPNTFAPDAGIEPIDAGTLPYDAGTPTYDAGTSTHDAGTSSPDAGSSAHDAGTSSPDAGTSTPDAGTSTPDAGTSTPDAGPATCTSAAVVISQVYGGGGNAGALYKADFIELHNRTGQPVSLTGWALQYASSAGTSWTSSPLPAGATLAPGAFALFAVGTVGTTGAALPGTATTLATALNLSATTGKVALTQTVTALTGSCPNSSALVDFFGYGGTNCSEGSMPAAALTSSTAGFRKELTGASVACTDTDVNADDFSNGAPAPHQGTAICSCP